MLQKFEKDCLHSLNTYKSIIRTFIMGYFSTISMDSDVRPAFVKSIKVSLYIIFLFDGGVKSEINKFGDLFDFFVSVIEEMSEALSSNASSLSDGCKSFPSLFSGPFRIL